MDDFIYQINRIKFKALTGTVLNSEKRSHTDTYTSTSGGGGYIYQGTGYVNAPRTTTRTVTTHTHEFWLAKEDGTEQCIKLTNTDIPLREGQKITMISAFREGDNKSSWIHLVNHSANRYWNILNEKEFVQEFIIRSLSTHGGTITFALLVSFFLLIFSMTHALPWQYSMIALTLGFGCGIQRSIETKKLDIQVKSHMDRIAQLAFKS